MDSGFFLGIAESILIDLCFDGEGIPVVERIEVPVCRDFINLERTDVALFIIDVCSALPV